MMKCSFYFADTSIYTKGDPFPSGTAHEEIWRSWYRQAMADSKPGPVGGKDMLCGSKKFMLASVQSKRRLQLLRLWSLLTNSEPPAHG